MSETTEPIDFDRALTGLVRLSALAHVAEVTGSVCHCAACTGARRAEAFRGEREHPRRERGGR